MNKKLLITNFDFIINKNQGDITKRMNPFYDSYSNLSDLITFETKGSLPVKSIYHDNNNLVSQVIDNLPSIEREFVKLYFFQGISIDEMALKSGISRSRLYYLKKKVMNRLRNDIKISCGRDIEDIFKDCVICNSEKREEINKFILSWLQDNKWYFKGLLKIINSEYGLTIPSLSLIISHIKFHMSVDKEKVLQNVSKKFKQNNNVNDEEVKVNLNITIGISIKRQIEQLSNNYGRTTSEIARMLIMLSLKPLKMILASQEQLFDTAVKISSDMNKIKSLEDIRL